MPESILGISAYYHDSAAAVITDGNIIGAAHEERFTRIKHDSSFPINAIQYVLSEAGLTLDDVSAVSFYDKPYLKFERLLETYHGFAPKGLKSFLAGIPVWIKEKLFMRRMLDEGFQKLNAGHPKKLLFPEHHLSHAASAFYPSPFNEAAILTVDGVGEWATSTIGHGKGNSISILRELGFPHSLGLLYSAFTYFCGFKVNSGEYKLMGLAPYGAKNSKRTKGFRQLILDELVDIRNDGSILLNMKYFNFATGMTMCVNEKWEYLFGIPRRETESEISQPYMDLAFAIQDITEKIILQLACTAREITGCENLVMAGGVALNCVANGELFKKGIFRNIWIQPAAGDAGGALGAAYSAWYIWLNKERKISIHKDSMEGAYLGPEYSSLDIKRTARKYDAPYREYSDFTILVDEVAGLLSIGNVIGWFQGRMEFGPRALGNRSILGDPRNADMQRKMNLKIKYREGFRPFAPSVLEEDITEYFNLNHPSPYMLIVAPVQEIRRNPLPADFEQLGLYERLYYQRSDIPAVTHVDYSARIQSVNRETNTRYWQLLNAFKRITGYGLLVNTSFNVRGEPIVCNPDDAYRCFMRTEMDYLVIGDFLFKKTEQKIWTENENWRNKFLLD